MIIQSFCSINNKIDIIGKNMLYYGDSITWGWNGSVQSQNSWVNQITTKTNTIKNNYGVSSMSLLTGHTPNFTSIYQTQIPIYNNNDSLIFLAFGVNDIYTNTYTDINSFINQYQIIINFIISKGWQTNRIIIFNTYYFTLGQINQSRIINQNNAINIFCTSNNIVLYDVYSQMINNGKDSLLSGDKVHPTDIGYTVITNGLDSLLKIHYIY